jgi:Domain of unknown function (DUF5134)
MTGPLWLAAAFTAVIASTAAYCLLRLVVSWRQHRPTDYLLDGVHVLMGAAMTGMLLPPLRVLPAAAWEAVFVVATAAFGWRLLAARPRRPAHQFHHLLGCAAMLYMLAAATQRSGGASTGEAALTAAARFPTLALILACGLLGYVVWTADRIPSLSRPAPSSAASPRAPLAAADLTAAGPAAADLTAADLTAGSGQGATSAAAACSGQTRCGAPLSPRLAACCEIAMGLTMGYMLITMLS